MRRNVILIVLLGLLMPVFSIGIDECQYKARNNYPLVKQFELIEKTEVYSVANASKSWLPQLNLNVRATYQSDVTEIPSSLSEILSKLANKPVSFQSLPQDQYQAQLEVNQLIWDGGAVRSQKNMIKQSAEIEKQQNEIQLCALKDRINQVYFGTLLIKEQIVQLQRLQSELSEYHKRIVSLKENGLADQTKLDQIKIEQLQAAQKMYELQAVSSNYLQVLSAFTGQEIKLNDLENPVPEAFEVGNLRPELSVFDGQMKLLDFQRKTLYSASQPKVGAFVQGGYGRPGLNMFAGDFQAYYITGIRLSWNISSFYTQKTELKKLKLNSEKIMSQKETFLFNQDLQAKQYKNELEKLKFQISKDDEIVALHEKIKSAELSKMDNGVLTLTDLIRETNLTEAAKQQKLTHQIQFWMSSYQLQNLYNQ